MLPEGLQNGDAYDWGAKAGQDAQAVLHTEAIELSEEHTGRYQHRTREHHVVDRRHDICSKHVQRLKEKICCSKK